MKMNQMSKRERILSALQYQLVDRLPWSPLIDKYFIRSLPAQWMPMDIIEAMRYIGNDIMERHVGNPQPKYRDLSFRMEEKDALFEVKK